VPSRIGRGEEGESVYSYLRVSETELSRAELLFFLNHFPLSPIPIAFLSWIK
jgi:hypothetical protein